MEKNWESDERIWNMIFRWIEWRNGSSIYRQRGEGKRPTSKLAAGVPECSTDDGELHDYSLSTLLERWLITCNLALTSWNFDINCFVKYFGLNHYLIRIQNNILQILVRFLTIIKILIEWINWDCHRCGGHVNSSPQWVDEYFLL